MTKEEAAAKLMEDFEKGWKSGEKEGWISLDEVEMQLGIEQRNEGPNITLEHHISIRNLGPIENCFSHK